MGNTVHDALSMPVVNSVYLDARGRLLSVTSIDLKDRGMRHVKGLVRDSNTGFNVSGDPYSCSIDIWVAVWCERQPSQERAGMEA